MIPDAVLDVPTTETFADVPLRDPDVVMRLSRLGSAHPMRLSFLRQMLRRARDEDWRFDRTLWQIDARGVGRACYRLTGPERAYTLIAFAHDLPAESRTDRVIATAWDATFALFDGEPGPADLDRLAANVPLQEAGRISAKELSLSRANRSVRLWDHVVDRLAAGRQPDAAALAQVGYLMRTTAVYGAGKFGAADRAAYACRPELSAPFQAEMISVWLTRAFTFDLVEHLAAVKGGAGAARLAPETRRELGVGNSTGLGLAPFLIRHPTLLNNWILARETALARVRSLGAASPKTISAFRAAVAAMIGNAGDWQSAHPVQLARLADLRRDLAAIAAKAAGDWIPTRPWDALWRWGEAALSEEGQEVLLSAMLEPQGALVDDLGDRMAADEDAVFVLDGAMTVASMRALIARDYAWACRLDFARPEESARFWYVSEEKLEPRLGDRSKEAGAEREQPLDVARAVQALEAALAGRKGSEPLGRILAELPQHRFAARRVQMTARHPYAEIRDNLLASGMLPIDILRCKLAFFGATRFDPKSDLWVRISLFQGEDGPECLRSSEVAVTGLSLTEMRTLAIKAARGAGFDWGLAEEAGFAVEWLARRGIDGPGLLADWLEAREKAGVQCPLVLGAGLADLPPSGAQPLGRVGCPQLLWPFAARAGAAVTSLAGKVLTPLADDVVWEPGRRMDLHVVAGRVESSPETLARLGALALRTTVPASTASRADAGAGMTDND